MNVFKITMGDENGDGHNLYQNFWVASHVGYEAVQKGIEKLEELYPGLFDLCTDYENTRVSKEFIESLDNHSNGTSYFAKYKLQEFFEEYDKDHYTFIEGAESYINLIIHFYNRHNYATKITLVPSPPSLLHNIGYGLFSM